MDRLRFAALRNHSMIRFLTLTAPGDWGEYMLSSQANKTNLAVPTRPSIILSCKIMEVGQIQFLSAMKVFIKMF